MEKAQTRAGLDLTYASHVSAPLQLAHCWSCEVEHKAVARPRTPPNGATPAIFRSGFAELFGARLRRKSPPRERIALACGIYQMPHVPPTNWRAMRFFPPRRGPGKR